MTDKRYSATGKYNALLTEHYEWSGRGPKRGRMKIATWVTPRNGDPYASWDTATLTTWDGELPPVGETIELIAKFVAEVYNGNLKGEYALINCRPADIPNSHASVPLEGGHQAAPGGDTRHTGLGPSAQPRMPPGATPTQYGPPDAGAYDLRDEAPPPTDADRSEWGF